MAVYRLELVFYQRLCIDLWYVTLGAEIASCRYIGQHVFVPVFEMCLADFGGAGFAVVFPAVAAQAFVRFQVDFVAVDFVRNQWRLLYVITRDRFAIFRVMFLTRALES